MHLRAGGRRRHRDRGTGLPLGAAAGPGPAAPAGRPGHRPAGRRGHLHLGPRGQRAAPRGRAGPGRPAGRRSATTCWPPASARSPRPRCAGTACRWSPRPGPARRPGPHDHRGTAAAGGQRQVGRPRCSPCAGHAAVVDGELRPLAPAPMAVLRALAADARPGALPRRPAAHAAARRRRARGRDGGGPAAGRPGYARAWCRPWSNAATVCRSTGSAEPVPGPAPTEVPSGRHDRAAPAGGGAAQPVRRISRPGSGTPGRAAPAGSPSRARPRSPAPA